jgi:transcription elongation factor Elf1
VSDKNDVKNIFSEKLINFMEANNKARAEAGLEGKPGSYEFDCPNCGTKCLASWVLLRNETHGCVGCATCNIGIRV